MLPSPPLHAGESTTISHRRHRHHAALPPSPASRPMEELWKDINLCSLHVPSTPSTSHRPSATSASNSSVDTSPSILHDFLSGGGSSPVARPPHPPSAGTKRLFDGDNGVPVDRRHKRLIMNRESAARSRARKQAYINELEAKVASLMEENLWLKDQRYKQEILQAPLAHRPPNKHGLRRTTSSPI